MGGFGSGQWFRYGTRLTTAHANEVLDVRLLWR